MDRGETEVLDQRRQEIGERSNGLDGQLAKDTEPDSVVCGGHLQSLHLSDLVLLLSCILNKTGDGQCLLIFREPLRRCWPVWDDEGGNKSDYDCGSSFDDKEPSVDSNINIVAHLSAVFQTYLQLAMRLPLKAASMPAANRPPKAPANIAPEKKIPRRLANSLRVYHPEKRKATPTKNGALVVFCQP